MQIVWLLLGLLCVGLGLIGIALPLIPTAPFLLLAAFFFARSSENLHNWLITHPTFGPMILDWQERGAIRPSAKRAATLSVAVAFLLSLLLGVPTKILIVQALALIGVLIFIWTRPSA
ncbi:YbaN family protein [Actibacterium pelagium]|uniref:DUF454 domain-containing protein n=1 Tax=Actibacterium pelagium TaxID=2029103 RepID=A0A917AJA6_9RHOB|nr:YbaN family protein [Actibacterium pelagium]GGE55433.1 hypothetical protein GCM10011517_23790 [Actibacterium pelagium]